MTLQEIFDTSAGGLLRQGEKSMGYTDPEDYESGDYSYRDLGGRRCALGFLIPDERYSRRLEGTRLTLMPAKGCEEKLARLKVACGLLREWEILLGIALQEVHDGESVGYWPEMLRQVAHRFGLSAAIVEELAPEGRDFP